MLPTPFFEPVVVGLLWTAWNFVLFLFSQHWLCERLHHLRFSFKTATYGWESAVMVAGLVKQRAAFFGFPSCRSCLAFFSVWLMVIQRLQKPKLQEQQGFCPQGENFDERERERSYNFSSWYLRNSRFFGRPKWRSWPLWSVCGEIRANWIQKLDWTFFEL